MEPCVDERVPVLPGRAHDRCHAAAAGNGLPGRPRGTGGAAMTTQHTAVADRAPGVVQPSAGPSVAPRSMPHPYRAMLAICSDLDETCDLDTYVETLRFLNT